MIFDKLKNNKDFAKKLSEGFARALVEGVGESLEQTIREVEKDAFENKELSRTLQLYYDKFKNESIKDGGLV